jgi:hypothetical protein
MARFDKRFSAHYDIDRAAIESTAGLDDLVEQDTSRADYVWLPLRFHDNTPTIEWTEEWRVKDWD